MRTLAIVLMVIFHFIYDLKFFHFISSDIPDGSGWQQFRWLIISLFFLCLGASLTLAYKQRFRPKKFFVRVLQIAGAAGVISIGSYLFIPKNWIFFGVLHFLAVSSLIGILFIHHPKISIGLGALFLITGALQIVPTRWPFHLLFDNLPSYTNDYVAFVPWFGMVLLGIGLAHANWFLKDPAKNLISYEKKWWVWPGKHSLSIYLLHQPLLMGALYLVTLLGN